MSKTIPFLAAFAITMLLPAAGTAPGIAAPISTKECKAADDRTKTQGGKTYKCTGCETCTTTTCQTGGTLSCTKETSTTCSCEEVASGPKPAQGATGGAVGGNTGVLDPGTRNQGVKKFNMPGTVILKKQ